MIICGKYLVILQNETGFDRKQIKNMKYLYNVIWKKMKKVKNLSTIKCY